MYLSMHMSYLATESPQQTYGFMNSAGTPCPSTRAPKVHRSGTTAQNNQKYHPLT